MLTIIRIEYLIKHHDYNRKVFADKHWAYGVSFRLSPKEVLLAFMNMAESCEKDHDVCRYEEG
ncbi:MAG: hypothetical protein EOM28_06635 [Clostridia bacterium]|nr:hypothetical protein [Clostridia bacterium]